MTKAAKIIADSDAGIEDHLIVFEFFKDKMGPSLCKFYLKAAGWSEKRQREAVNAMIIHARYNQ